MSHVIVRPAEPADAPALSDIYDWYVADSPATFDLEPMGIDARKDWLVEHGGGHHRVLVAVHGDAVLGYASSSRFRARPAYAQTVETSVYVDHAHLGEGIGGRLYAALFEALADEDLHRACAGISLPNPASEALHRRLGFRHVGTFTEQGWKFGRYWDVAWFEKDLPHRSSAGAGY